MKKKRNRGTEVKPAMEDKNSIDKNSGIRLNKYIASCGICSRRDADELIKAGMIKVNNTVTSELGKKIFLHDEVSYNGKILNPEKYIYILLNKPKNCVTTLSDPHAKRTVIDIVKTPNNERIFPVGRLDKDTTGVLLLTNDGDLAEKLTHPSYNKLKIYHVYLDKDLSDEHYNHIKKGFELEDGYIKADDLSFVSDDEKNHVGIEIHSGRNRIVRRMFSHFGYTVVKLDRVYFAGLTKKGLQRGHSRMLSNREISMLKMGNYK